MNKTEIINKPVYHENQTLGLYVRTIILKSKCLNTEKRMYLQGLSYN